MSNLHPHLHQHIAQLQSDYYKLKDVIMDKKRQCTLQPHDIEEFGNLMNAIGMKYSQVGSHQLAEQWLKRVLKYAQSSINLKLITYNNLACVYRQSNNLPLALLYIKKAQKQGEKIGNNKRTHIMTDCSLNLCAILSSMKEHKKALMTARKVLTYLEQANKNQKVPLSYYQSVYPIIKYNEAVQLQNLKEYEEALKCYESAKKTGNIDGQLLERIEEGKKALKKVCEKKMKRSSSQNRKEFQFFGEENILGEKVGRLNKLPELKLGGKDKKKEYFSARKITSIQNSYLTSELPTPSRKNY